MIGSRMMMPAFLAASFTPIQPAFLDAHPGDERLPALLVERPVEGRVLFAHLHERVAHLVLVFLALRLQRHPDNGLGELDVLKDYRAVLVTQRVARERFLETHGRRDAA